VPPFFFQEDKRTTPWEFLVHLAGGIAGADVPLEEIRRYCTKANLLRYHLKHLGKYHENTIPIEFL